MSHFVVVKTVEDRVNAWFHRCPVYVENAIGQGEAPADGGPWLQIQFPFARTEWIETEGADGSGFQEEGGARFVLSVERGYGAHEGRQWLDELARLFRGVQVNGVQFNAPTSAVADDRNEVAGYYRLSFVAPYEFNFTEKEIA